MKSFTLAKNLSPAPAWARETVLPGGDRYFVRLLEAFSQATSSIDLETYIFENGPLGNAVLGALETAAARGVRVRLIVDGLGSPSFNRSAVIALAERGIDVRVYHPLPWVWFSFSGFLSLFFKLNRRDHRKLCVIDGRIAFTGSMNVSADHLKEHRGTAAWRDTGVEVEGPDAGNLVRAFERTWMRATGVHHRLGRWSPSPWRRFRNQSALVRLNTSRSARRRYYRDLLRRITQARHRVWITNAYFAPDILLARALRVAAWGGADVRVLVPKKSDIFFMPWVTEAFYHHLLRAGVRVYEFLPSILHAKTLLIDDWGTIGSSNLNHRSLLHDLEADFVVGHHESIDALATLFEEDLRQSREIFLGEWKGLPLSRRMVAKILLFFRYFI